MTTTTNTPQFIKQLMTELESIPFYDDKKLTYCMSNGNHVIWVEADRFFDRICGNGWMYGVRDKLIIDNNGVIVNCTGCWSDFFNIAVKKLLGQRMIDYVTRSSNLYHWLLHRYHKCNNADSYHMVNTLHHRYCDVLKKKLAI